MFTDTEALNTATLQHVELPLPLVCQDSELLEWIYIYLYRHIVPSLFIYESCEKGEVGGFSVYVYICS